MVETRSPCILVCIILYMVCMTDNKLIIYVKGHFLRRLAASRRKECTLFVCAYSGGRFQRAGADSRSQTVYRNDFLILVPTLRIGVGT